MTKTRVAVKHSGSCAGFSYRAGEAVLLPDHVLAALGEANYDVLEQPKKVEQKQMKQPPVDKMMRSDDAEKKDAEPEEEVKADEEPKEDK